MRGTKGGQGSPVSSFVPNQMLNGQRGGGAVGDESKLGEAIAGAVEVAVGAGAVVDDQDGGRGGPVVRIQGCGGKGEGIGEESRLY